MTTLMLAKGMHSIININRSSLFALFTISLALLSCKKNESEPEYKYGGKNKAKLYFMREYGQSPPSQYDHFNICIDNSYILYSPAGGKGYSYNCEENEYFAFIDAGSHVVTAQPTLDSRIAFKWSVNINAQECQELKLFNGSVNIGYSCFTTTVNGNSFENGPSSLIDDNVGPNLGNISFIVIDNNDLTKLCVRNFTNPSVKNSLRFVIIDETTGKFDEFFGNTLSTPSKLFVNSKIFKVNKTHKYSWHIQTNVGCLAGKYNFDYMEDSTSSDMTIIVTEEDFS